MGTVIDAPSATPDRLARRPEDQIAREMEQRTGGRWLVWFGHVTGHYWATPREPYPWHGLIENVSPVGLMAAIGQVETFFGAGPQW